PGRDHQRTRAAFRLQSLDTDGAARTLPAPRLLAEAREVALRNRREALACQRARLRRIDDVLERAGDQHAAHARIAGRDAGHLVEHGEAALDLLAGHAALLDGSREVLSEARIEEVIVVADLESRFREEVGEV